MRLAYPFHKILYSQLRPVLPVIAGIATISTLLLGAVLFLHVQYHIPVGDLTRDPTAVSRAPFYTGLLSQLGIFLWAGAAFACLIPVIVSFQHPFRQFLLASGLITLTLALDDVFLLHESALPMAGFPEKIVLIFYAGLLTAYVAWFYRVIKNTAYGLLLIACLCFGLSLLIDLLTPNSTNMEFLLEDGAKLVGIVSWLAYYLCVATGALRQDRPGG